jgi:hypothetical protein
LSNVTQSWESLASIKDIARDNSVAINPAQGAYSGYKFGEYYGGKPGGMFCGAALPC